MKDELRKEALNNELASKSIGLLGDNVSILHKEVEQWNDTVNKMRQDYNETIHSLIPETFEKRWVKNIEKKGKLVWWKYFTLITLGNYFNLFFSIDTLGGYMEWNINPDKLIIEWIVNRTPQSCIQVNILLIAMATNPNSEVAKMVPCINISRICVVLCPCSPSAWQACTLAYRYRLSSYTLMQQAK